MASGTYNQFKAELMNGTYLLASHTIKAALLDASHAFDADNVGWASVSANEVASGGGYTTGGETLTTPTVQQDDTDDEGVFNSDDVSWASATFSASHAVLYDDTTTSPLDALICSIDFGGSQSVAGGTFTIQWATEGIINIT